MSHVLQLAAKLVFNLLDARGVISVTDRAQYIEKIRKLAREVASSWMKERELLNFPLLKINKKQM